MNPPQPLPAGPVPNIHQAERLRPTEAILGMGYALVIGAAETEGRFELMKFVAPAGRGAPPHIHHHEDECFYILEGDFEIGIGGTVRRAGRGDSAFLPRGVPHHFRNVGSSAGAFLCCVMPGQLGGFFDAFKNPWPASSVDPPPPTDDDVARLMVAAKRYSIEILAS
jgi:mannose-6-phosphate isomerase-like protein (cupin superfamily)